MPDNSSENGREDLGPRQLAAATPQNINESRLFAQILAGYEKQPTPDAELNYVASVYLALKLDLDNPVPKPASPQQIYEKTKFSPQTLFNYGICIKKASAPAFLEDLGCPNINMSFSKRYNRTTYSDLFRRQAAVVHRRQMLLTPAEWLHLVEYEVELPLPPVLDEFAKNNWKMLQEVIENGQEDKA